MKESFRHLVIVRHGESEGDARREAWRRGELSITQAFPEHEELTANGYTQSHAAGEWILRNIYAPFDLPAFDRYFVSPPRRTIQTAVALELPDAVWQKEPLLSERDRGKVRGMHPEQHIKLYPDSFELMHKDPLHWSPPDGEIFMTNFIGRIIKFVDNIEQDESVIAVTHRDWAWGAAIVLENLNEKQALAINTDEIHNAQVIHYTCVDPRTLKFTPGSLWKRSVDPMNDNGGKSFAQQYVQIR